MMHCWPHDGIAEAVAIQGLDPVAAAQLLPPEPEPEPEGLDCDVGVVVGEVAFPPPLPPDEQADVGFALLHEHTASADD